MKEIENRLIENLKNALNKILEENIIDHNSIINDLGEDLPKYEKETIEEIKKNFKRYLDNELVKNGFIIESESINNICTIFNTNIEMVVPLQNLVTTDHKAHDFSRDTMMDMFLSQLPNRIGSGNKEKLIIVIINVIEKLRKEYQDLRQYNKVQLTGPDDNDKIVPDKASPFER